MAVLVPYSHSSNLACNMKHKIEGAIAIIFFRA